MTAALDISPLRKKFGLHLLERHAARLEAAGITPAMAAARGYHSIDTKANLARRGFGPAQRRVPGLLIPVYDVTGKRAFDLYRPDDPRRDARGRIVKYEFPRNIRMVIDVHPHAREGLGDPTRPLLITEGVLKADAAVARGLCCISLCGVWSWRGRNEKGGKVALADWESVALNGRTVHVVFDSDVMTKPEVQAALRRLKAFLERRGARVFVVYMPPREDGGKQGVDDYLAAHSVGKLLALASEELREPEATPAPKTAEAAAASSLPDGPPPDLQELLCRVAAYMRQYVMYANPWQQVADVLWIAHTHAIEAFDITPYLHTSSPLPQSGKTVSQEARARLVRQPRGPVIMPSEAVVYRKVDKTPGLTLLLDEVDPIFGDKANAHEGLRALLNSGNRRGAVVPRCVGDKQELVDFNTFCAKSTSGLGALPPSLADRSISLPLQRATAAERKTIRRFRYAEAERGAAPIRAALARWAKDAASKLRDARPDIPEELDGRQADAWEGLLAIADAAGGDWPALARAAALELHGKAQNAQAEAVGLATLRAVCDVFQQRGNAKHVLTADLLNALVDRDDGPWAEWWGQAVEARKTFRSFPPTWL
jgi:hypothetical protein